MLARRVSSANSRQSDLLSLPAVFADCLLALRTHRHSPGSLWGCVQVLGGFLFQSCDVNQKLFLASFSSFPGVKLVSLEQLPVTQSHKNRAELFPAAVRLLRLLSGSLVFLICVRICLLCPKHLDGFVFRTDQQQNLDEQQAAAACKLL